MSGTGRQFSGYEAGVENAGGGELLIETVDREVGLTHWEGGNLDKPPKTLGPDFGQLPVPGNRMDRRDRRPVRVAMPSNGEGSRGISKSQESHR